MPPKDLLAAASAVWDRPFVPYSRFKVTAAIRTRSGRIHAGVNVENVAYPQSQCAEASTIGIMVAAGDTAIDEVLVLAEGSQLIAPCGGCRQRLAEFARPGTKVHLCHPDGRHLATTMAELLPFAFTPGHLDPAATAAAPERSALAAVRARAPGLDPAIAIVLGSGLGGLADELTEPVAIPYAELPDFPVSTVPGHAGRLILGRLGAVPVMCFQGRVHLYEGGPATAVLPMLRLVHELGCDRLLLTNAAGSLHADRQAGSLALITDHINFLGTNPLVGGTNFVGLNEVYDRPMGEALRQAAAGLAIPLPDGVYLATLGPCFETPAEIRAFRTLGADLVGMSTVPEAIAARYLGLRVAAISAITNLAAGMSTQELSHGQTLDGARLAGPKLLLLVRHALEALVRA